MSQEIVNEISNCDTVREICKPFILDDDTLRKVKDIFLNELKRGLCKFTQHKANVRCLVTHFQSLPTRCETGKFLAIHLGETNLRIFYVNIERKETFRVDSEYAIHESLMVGPGKELFNYIAECLEEFLKTNEAVTDEKLPLGFIFSFPFRQNDVDKGILIAWKRDFDCSGVIGEDVVELLRQAIDRKEIANVDITALLNDSTGVLMSCAWDSPYCKVGVVIDDDFKICYLEKIKNLNTFEIGPNNKLPTIIIDCEFSAFGDNGTLEFIRTQHDIEIDEASQNRESQIFEKMVTGFNLGELARRIMLECCKAGALFNGQQSDRLARKNTFKRTHLSKVEEDLQGSYDNVKTTLKELGYNDPTDDDCENVRYICECVSQRSANLVSSVLSCLVERVGDPYLLIGIDGNVYKQHPYYHNLLKAKTKTLTRPENKFDIALSEHGSEWGGAVSAAVASIIKKKALEKTKDES